MRTIFRYTGIFFLIFSGAGQTLAQWAANGNNIYNTNSGNVGIGTNSPATLLHVAKSMTEPTITVQNLGGSGGATYVMLDNASGANWKFKATLSGGFKIRDHANLMDVIVIEPNSFANAIYISGSQSIGIGTSNPNSSALLDISSNVKGFLPPRMTLAQIEGIPGPASGLIVFCTTDEKLYIYVNSAGLWKEVPYGTETINPNETCGSPIVRNHVAGTVAPVDKTVTYGTVLSDLSGIQQCWITQNLGADYQATTVNQTTEPPAGWYWQFNRQQGYKHDGSVRTPSTAWITDITENYDWQPENDPCYLLLGTGWRLPTNTEWTNADINGEWDNANEAFASVLKLHMAGVLTDATGNLAARGTDGDCWSSTQNSTTQSKMLHYSTSNCQIQNSNKEFGLNVRCIK